MLEDHRRDPSVDSASCADEVANPGEVKWFTVKINTRSYRIGGVNKIVKTTFFLVLCILLSCLIITLPLNWSSKHIGDIGNIVGSIIRKRWIKAFLVGAGVTAFATIAAGATAFTAVSCKASLAAAWIGASVWPATSPACIGSAALTSASTAIAGGLYAYGNGQGWVFESNGTSIGIGALNGTTL
ncbi:hypothetical protein V1525DRAFT_30816 [Lipomyces kononenkoae]|uniref:Uncharacterized protein n=1 Tax=Lipomyces kononenkoae TaxID=34357 RepID=A0ACC3SU06_LIPKO